MASEQARLLPGVVALNVAPPEDTGAAPAKQHVKPGLWKLLAVWCRLARLWFTGSDRYLAWKLALASLALSVATSLILLKLSYVQNDLSSALAEKQQSEFYGALGQFGVVAAVATPLFALTDWLDGFAMIRWRGWLTEQLLAAYYADRAYYLLQLQGPRALDNPDQRICDDVRSFVASSVLLAVGMLRKLFYLATFSGLLLSIAPHVFGFLLLYAAAGTLISAYVFGRPLVSRTYAVLRREADLRHQLIRLREAAESVAFFGGEEREAAESGTRLRLAIAAGLHRLALEAGLGVWLNAYSNLTTVVPSLLMAPRYFAGEARFGEISQVAFTFQRIEAAVSYLVNNLAELSALAAQTERLDELLKALGQGHPPGRLARRRPATEIARRSTPDPGMLLSLAGLSFAAPGGGPLLASDLNLTLQTGQSLLIVGPSGCGKSSLLRCIAGLWTRGSGSIVTPPVDLLFFLPQKPFMCLGNLADQLCFPHNRQPGEEASLAACLDAARLPALIERVGGLDAETDWAMELSMGEQQRVAFARLFHQAPALAFLDESTSGLDPATEAAMYAELRRRGTACVSIGHRPQLVQWHTHVLECVGDAEWVFSTAEEYLQRRERGPVPRAASAVAPPSVSHSAGPTPGSHAATEGVLLGEDSFMERLTPRRSTVL